MRIISGLLFTLVILVAHPTNARVFFRPLAGLGFTSNANLEETDKDSDFYYLVRGSASLTADPAYYAATVSFRGFLDQTSQNVVNFNVQSFIPTQIASSSNWEVDVGVGGQHYTNDSPGVTEDSFDNYFLTTGLTKTLFIESTEVFVGPRYELRNYPDFDGRTDNIFAVESSLEWKFQKRHTIEPALALGFVSSSRDLYNRRYFELGADWSYYIKRDLLSKVSFLSRFSTYPDRTVSDPTAVSQRRGKGNANQGDDQETQTLTQLAGSVVKIRGNSEFKAEVSANTQKSKSATADYSELGFIVSAQFKF